MKRFKIHSFSCLVAAVLIPLLLTTAVAQAQVAPWTVVQSPNPLAGGNQLNGVASVSANDVWAVGVALTLHWNGKKWSVVKSPNTGPANQLYAVAAVSTNDVWAVGFFQTVSGTRQTLTLHWNGHKWSIVASPNPGSADNFFLAVAAVSTNDVWAVGGSSVLPAAPLSFRR